MRLTTVILIASLLQVSASTFGQKVTLRKKAISIKKVFEELEKQTGYSVIYFHNNFDDKKNVDVNFSQAPLDQVMNKVLAGLPFNFVIVDQSIVLREKPKTFIDNIIDVFTNIDVHGRVVDENGNGLSGAVIRLKDGNKKAVSDANGYFNLNAVDENAVLTISYLGFQVQEVKVRKDVGEIRMQEISGQLNEVGVVSTGYQNIPKERATGSFVLVDSALLNRKVSTNILDRLDGVTSGLIFNKNRIGNTPEYSVRGRSTINSNTNPLIILDNFPYDGDISNINPQDIKSITVLKDGAAASIWGSRAGNGVIVLTTYKGNYNQKPLISFNSNVTIGDKPDVYYKEQLTNSQYIGVEQFLFDKGAYNNTINNGYGALSPAVEIMLLNRKGIISNQQKSTMLDSIAQHDNRTDLNKYYYRKSITQQYQINVNGGGQNNKYYISLGYDKNNPNTIINNNDRITLNAKNTLSLLNNKLEVLTGILLSSSNTKTTGPVYQPGYPYESIADKNGNPIAITDGTLRIAYVDTVGKGKLLDWHYRPLDEINNGYTSSTSRLTDYRVDLGLNYKLIPTLSVSVNYTYDKGIIESSNNNNINSYYTRNQINTFSQISPTTGLVTYPIPLGDILSNSNSSYYSNYGRGQLNYNNTFARKHSLNVIAGFEVKDYRSTSLAYSLYGYNTETATNLNSNINSTQFYPYIYGFNSSKIYTNINNIGSVDRYRSYYINGSYAYDKKYVLSFSARKDESNLFGVKPNQKGVPLWSTGLSWHLSDEKFYKIDFLNYLTLRATYGYNGNVNKTISAYLTGMTTSFGNQWGQQYVNIQNPPNPSLEWEKVKNLNFAVDFGSKNNILTGSIEYWMKTGLNLIGTSPIAGQTGITTFTGNNASMQGKGFDIVLNSKLFQQKKIKWYTTLLFNTNVDKITEFNVKPTINANIVTSNYNTPLVGYSYYSLFSYKWMGLNNLGNPQSVLNGVTSTNYSGITRSTNYSELIYSGTLSPKYFGNLINIISYKSFELSLNISYKLGYVFRRTSLNGPQLYQSLRGAISYQQPDYNLRWQKPGDEQTTNVPSLIYPTNPTRESVYTNSSILVEKGDHIRLQDVKLNYILSKSKSTWLPFSHVSIYSYVSNLGVIWKASKYKIDPDYPTGIPLPTTLAIGLKADF